MPKRTPVSEKLAAQEKAIKDAQKKLEKIKEDEAKRLLKIFDNVGFFDVDVSDEALTSGLKKMVKEASSTQKTPELESA